MSSRDTDTIKILRTGDKNAFIGIFRSYYPELYSYAAKIVDSFEIAREIVQDAFIYLWENRNKILINTSVRSYLFKTVRNDCLDYIKHKKIEQKYITTHLSIIRNESYSEDNLFAQKEITQILKSSVSSLPKECKKIFILSRYKDLKNKDIAKRLGISVKTVESQIGKALKLLRKNLKDYLHNL
jgi:RNA polymerase sigma-70 factor (ECF subfamily)